MRWNPAVHADRKELCMSLCVEFDEACEKLLERKKRGHHLGVASIGEICYRKLWYKFRWVKKERVGSKGYTPGQMMRVWKRGKDEEPNIIRFLEASGHTFFEPPEGMKQHRIEKFGKGHCAGECDAIGRLPAKYELNETILYEFKALKQEVFNKVKTQGIAKCEKTAKYFDQVSVYGPEFNLRFCLFVIINKNTEEVWMELILLDPRIRDELKSKGEEIVFATEPPAKVYQSRTNWYCQACSFVGVCYDDEPVDKNCRSCKFARPVENSEWYCDRWASLIPLEGLPVGCDEHEGIF